MSKRIALGTYSIKNVTIMKNCIREAINAGYDLVDTAYIYKNEEVVGKAMAELKKEGLKKSIRIQTKIWPDDFGNVKKAVLAACKKLGVEKLDVCLLHRRHPEGIKLEIKAWKDLIECQKQGLVEEIGVSNFDRDIIEIIRQKVGVYPSINQIELSVNNFREDRVVYNQSKNIEIQAWSPMGDLEKNLKDKTLLAIAKKYKTDVPSILVAYLSSQGFSVIVKTATPERVKLNKQAFKLKLNKEDIEKLRSLNTYTIKYSETYEYDIHK